MWTPKQIEEVGLDDFRVFLAEVWAFLGLPSPTRVQYDIGRYMQHGPRRRMIEAFRGVGKSYEAAAFVAYNLFRDPQFKTMIVTASSPLAREISTFVMSLVEEMPLLSFLKPDHTVRRTSVDAWDVRGARPSKSPSVKCTGLRGQLTGTRANLILADDIEILKNAYSHTLREQNSELVKEFDAVLLPGGQILYLGTPQVEDSLYNRLPARGYDIRVWPSEVPDSADRYHGRLAPMIHKMMEEGIPEKTPTDPDRFDRQDLDERRISYGKAGYALQFMLDTTPADLERHPLKLKDLIVTDVDREVGNVKLVWSGDARYVVKGLEAGGFDGDYYHAPAWASEEMTPFTSTVMAIDPSGLGKDETAYAVVRVLYSQLFLVASGGFKDGFSEATLNKLAKIASLYNVNEVITERNFGGGMFGSLLKPRLHALGKVRFNPENHPWHTGQKEVRVIRTLEPLMKAHRLIVDREVIEEDLKQLRNDPQYSLIYQMTRITTDKGALPHEDRLEAVQMACDYHLKRMEMDRTEAVKSFRSDKINQELRKFMQNALGRRPAGPKWARPRPTR